MPNAFCPECQATWDQPWYDVCPACGHRFGGRPGWQSAWVILLAICAPSVLLLVFSATMRGASSDIPGFLNLLGSGLAGAIAGLMTACRLHPKGQGRLLTFLALAPVYFVVSFTLGFFSCMVVVAQ